jgi:hypothetical protein
MRVLLSAALAAMSLPLAVACSDDGGGDGGGDDGGGGGSGPVAQGAVNMEVYATPAQTCPPGNVHIDLGNAQSSPQVKVIDGEDGAQVLCTVAPAGAELDASGSIQRGNLRFQFAVLTGGQSATGSVGFLDPASGAAYSSPEGSPCVFQFAPSSGQGIEAGRIWVQFDCANLVNEQDPAAACSSRYGYLILENCEQGEN